MSDKPKREKFEIWVFGVDFGDPKLYLWHRSYMKLAYNSRDKLIDWQEKRIAELEAFDRSHKMTFAEERKHIAELEDQNTLHEKHIKGLAIDLTVSVLDGDNLKGNEATMKARIAELEKALQFYADRKSYHACSAGCCVYEEGAPSNKEYDIAEGNVGHKARAALRGQGEEK